MRTLLIILIVITIVTSCRKVECGSHGILLQYAADTLMPDSSIVKIKKYAKGTDWSTPIDNSSSVVNFKVSSTGFDISADYDYMIEIENPYKQYKIKDIAYTKTNTYESGIAQTYTSCSNPISYNINGQTVKTSRMDGGERSGYLLKQKINISRY